MKPERIAKVPAVWWFIIVVLHTTVLPAQTNRTDRTVSSKNIATNFIADAVLTDNEVGQVIELAKLCGIETASEVRTFQWLPGGGKGISVKSVERVDGRNTSFDTLTISKMGWDQFRSVEGSKHVGDFRANADAKYSTLLRSYVFRGAAIKISIGKGMDIAIADEIISRIDAKKVQFEDGVRGNFEHFDDSKPAAIGKSYSGTGYELRFDTHPMQVLMFDWKDGKVIVTGVSTIRI